MNIGSLISALPGAVAQGLIWGIMAIGVFLTYKVLDFADLTVDGTMATGGAVCVMLLLNGVNLWVALLCAVLAGMVAGLVTGLFHTAMGIPAILSGILTQLSLYSVNLAIMGFKANQGINFRTTKILISSRNVKVIGLENPIFIMVIVTGLLIAVLYWFFGREIGAALRATGSNEHMARAQGINTKFNTVLGFMLANALVSLAGALLSQYQGSADVNMGRGAIVIGLAAVIIGEVIFGKIFINFALRLLAVIIGAVIYYIVLQIILQLGLNTNDLKLLTAILVAIFLAIPYIKGKVAPKKVPVPAAAEAETPAEGGEKDA